MLRKDFPYVKCLIVGDGPDRNSLEIMAKNSGLTSEVIFTGMKTDAQELFLAMDLFIQASILKEGLPLALAEAASAGLPLVATDIGGNPELVKDGLNGFVIKPKDAFLLSEKIKYFLEHPQKAKEAGENSKKIWLDKFTLEEMLCKIGNVYKERQR
jgi:glycosyltransferase involved in cell wall biosynthesis